MKLKKFLIFYKKSLIILVLYFTHSHTVVAEAPEAHLNKDISALMRFITFPTYLATKSSLVLCFSSSIKEATKHATTFNGTFWSKRPVKTKVLNLKKDNYRQCDAIVLVDYFDQAPLRLKNQLIVGLDQRSLDRIPMVSIAVGRASSRIRVDIESFKFAGLNVSSELLELGYCLSKVSR